MPQSKRSPTESLRRLLIGRPIPTANAHHERLGPLIGLPVFSSDALSSVAYATEAILGVLALYSVEALGFQLAISVTICLLIIVVAFSYLQTIHAYPTGGGSYIVASENLGETPGLFAGAALLIDYVLTVSVSVCAGVAAIISAYPQFQPYLVPIAIGCVAAVTWANLRGVRESGLLFAVPAYGFIAGMAIMVTFGVYKALGTPVVIAPHVHAGTRLGAEHNFSQLFIILRAFAAGCTALTGIEAVSDGIQAFRAPESKNASTTLLWMAGILTFMFLGTGYLVRHMTDITLYDPAHTLVSQIAAWVFGDKTIFFYYIQFSTAAILILAANTSFADFPRLSSFIARDGYLPRPLARQGDRLVFHNGIIFLAVCACALIWKFHGELDALLPLYAVGVFAAFSLSQLGMVMHWYRLRETGWKRSAWINGIGASLTFVVTIIILVTKFAEGAWIVAILLPIIFSFFKAIKARYIAISKQLAVGDVPPPSPSSHLSILLVPRIHRGILAALDYARLIDLECRAVHVAINKKALPEVQHQWETFGGGTPLVVLKSQFRSLILPVLDYVDKLHDENPDQVITVIVPEAIAHKWYHKLLQENVANQLKRSLGARKNVVVTNVRYFLD